MYILVYIQQPIYYKFITEKIILIYEIYMYIYIYIY